MAVDKRAGTLRWKPNKLGPKQAAIKTLSDLLVVLQSWPIEQFSRDWWAGDYRLLELRWRLPQDSEVVVTCHAAAGAEFLDVAVEARVRSKAKVRAMSAAEQAALRSAGFGLPSSHRAELLHRRDPEQEHQLSLKILQEVSRAFGLDRGATVRFDVKEGTRLDDMPVFQDITPHELLAVLRASGLDVRVLAGDGGTASEPLIAVEHDVRFVLRLSEPKESGFLTIRLDAGFEVSLSADEVNRMNSNLPFATAVIEGEELSVRSYICVSGGISHAGVRDRIDDWMAALEQVRRMLGGRERRAGERSVH